MNFDNVDFSLLDDAEEQSQGEKLPVVETPESIASDIDFTNVDFDSLDDGDTNQRANVNIKEAVKINPDEHAKNKELSRQSGVPMSAVKNNADVIEQDVKSNNINISEDNPKTAEYLSNLDNAVIAQDDVPVLSAIENVLSTLGSLAEVLPPERIADIARAFPAGAVQGLGSTLEGSSRAISATRRIIDRVVPEKVKFETPFDDISNLIPLLLQLEGQKLKRGSKVIGVPEDRADIFTDISGGLGQLFQQAITSVVNKSASTVNLFSQGVDQQAERQKQTGTEGESLIADVAVLGSGGITYLLEKTGIDQLLNRIPANIKNKFLKNLTDLGIAGAIEAVQEVVEDISHGFVEMYTTNPDAEIFEGLDRTAIVAGSVGFIARAFVPGRLRSVQQQEDDKQARSEVEQENIDNLNEQSEKSKTRERDKESFKQFVEDADGDNNTTVFIDSEKVQEYLATKKLAEIDADPALTLLAKQADEAAALNTDVQIPVADFATNFNDEIFTELRDGMTMNEDSTTPFRQEQYNKDVESRLKSLMEEAKSQASEYADSQEIADKIYTELADTGVYAPDVARTMADIAPAYFAAKAEREGITVKEAYESFGFTVEGPQTGERARQADELILEQPAYKDAPEIFDSVRDEFLNVLPEDAESSDVMDAISEFSPEYKNFIKALERDDWLGFDFPSQAINAALSEEIDNYEVSKGLKQSIGKMVNKAFGVAPRKQSAKLKEQTKGDINESEKNRQVRKPDGRKAVAAEEVSTQQKTIEEAKSRTDKQALAEFNRAKNGETVTFVHRSPYDFNEFDDSLLDQIDLEKTPSGNLGHYLSADDISNADKYGNVVSVFQFKLENPMYIDEDAFESLSEDLTHERANELRQNYKDMGNDGILIEGLNQVIIFEGATVTKLEEDTSVLDDVQFEQKDNKQARGYYDPANSVIRLTEAANLSTFLHEFAHFMYEMEVNGDTPMLQDINKWYKRNAEEVAAEANGYLGDTGDVLEQGGAFESLEKKWSEERFDRIKKAQNDTLEYADLENPDDIIFSHTNDVEEYISKDLGLFIDTDVSGYGSTYINIYINEDAYDNDVEPIVIRFGTHDTPVQYIGEHGYKLPDYDIRNSSQILDVLENVKNKFSVTEQFKQDPNAPTPTTGSITEADVVAFLDQTTTGDKAKDAAIRRAVHEQFARGFEQYLMEGKAPSIELRNIFRTFARWLVQVYNSIKGGLRNVNLDDQMRKVFDRLIATEEQIAAAEARAQVEPMFTDAAMAGMTEKQFADYQAQQQKTKDVSSETLRDKMIEQLTRQTKKWWKEEKQDIVDEQIDILKKERVYAARESLKSGDLKMDHATVKEMAGQKRTDKRGKTSTIIPPALNNMTAKGQQGVHPDEAAAFLGYSSGSEMIDDLINAPKIDKQASDNAEAEMVKRHGDILTDGTIEREADEAVRNEERGKLILKELKTLAKGTNVPTIDRATIKESAITNIGKLSFREIFPGKYRKAEIRAAQEAATMLAAGNKEGAAAAKLRQVMNYYLGMEATKAKNETMKIVDRMARYNKKKVREEIVKAENGYWEQIANILNRFEFRKSASLKQVENLNLWVKNRTENEGDGLVLSNVVLNEAYVTHWKNIPFSDLQGVNDSVKNIEHVARYANKIKLQQEEIDFKKLKSNWVDSINENDTRFPTKETRSRIDDARKATAMEHVRRWASQLTKVPFLASWLDGGARTGISQDILVQPLTDALDEKMKMVDEVATPVMEAIGNRSKEDQKRHNTKIWIPEIEDNLMGHQVLAVALNVGNQGNLKKMLLGEGWADPEVETDITIDNPKLQAVLKHMTKSDWELVQTIWDQMEKLYKPLAEVHRRTTGLTPPQVESTPIETEFGTFKGGYYPVKYSTKRSHKAEKNAEKRDAETESMFNNTASIQASVNAGATNERTGFYDRVDLSLNVVPDHFNETIHYITHHDAVRQINRLIQAPEVANAITAVLGDAEYKQLKPWLNDVAKDGRQQPFKGYIDEAFKKLRFGVTLGVMGFKASTGIMQLFGIFTTAAELGVGPTIKGIQTTIGRSWYMKAIRNTLGSVDDMQTGWDFAAEKSKVMNHRVKTMDREIKNAMTKLQGKTGFLAAVQETSMKHIALIQTYMIDLPTWHAAYDKELSESGDEAAAVKRADWSVENLQGSGATKDMATILRNQGGIHSSFTMFMTFFSSLGNLSRDLVKGAKTGQYSKTSVAAKLMFLYTLPVFFEMLMRGDLDEPEDDDERLGKFLTLTALYPITGIPFVRDVVSGLIGDYGYNSSPVASVLGKGITGLKQAERLFTDEEITKGAAKNVSKLAGASLGIPGINQIWATGEHLYDVLEEGEDLTLRELTFGPDRE